MEASRRSMDRGASTMKLTEAQTEQSIRLIRLIAAEFKSDPMSVQCFDITYIVKPTIELAEELTTELLKETKE